MHGVWLRLKTLIRALVFIAVLRLPIPPSLALEVSRSFHKSAAGEELDKSPNINNRSLVEYLSSRSSLDCIDGSDSYSLQPEELPGLAQPDSVVISEAEAEKEPPPSLAEIDGTKVQPTAEIDRQEEDEDRHNFALAKDGAKIIAANKEAKKTSAVLDSDGDTFLKNECKADKWLIIELSQVTKVDTLLISQNELYSSRMKEFEVKGRNSHPRTEGNDYSKTLNSTQWQMLGKFNASNTKGVQAFKLEQPSWLKYLQIHQLSHYGGEAVCALNDVCVYGKSAAEDLEDRLAQEAAAEDSQAAGGGTEKPVVDIDLNPAVPPEDVLAGLQAGAELVNGKDSITGGGLNLSNYTGALDDDQVQKEEKGLSGQTGRDLHTTSEATLPGPEPAAEAGNESRRADVSPTSSNKSSEGSGSKQVSEELPRSNGAPTQRDSGSKNSVEEQLAANSAGSTASRHGGSMYDIIVQELKAIKLNQKDNARNLTQFQKNVTAVLGRLAIEIDLLATRLDRLDPPLPALLPPGHTAEIPIAAADSDSQNCSADEVLDFREGESRRADAPPSLQVLKAPTELEILQQEVARMKFAFDNAKKQIDGLLLALAFAFLGGIGVNAAITSSIGQPFLRGCLAVLACVPLALALGTWLSKCYGL